MIRTVILSLLIITNSCFAIEPYQIAKQFIGQTKNSKNLYTYFLTAGWHINPKQISWCAIFINSILTHLHLNGTHSALAKSFTHIGSQVKVPKTGDIVIFNDMTKHHDPSKGHVGFYIGEKGDKVISLGGNQDDAVKIKEYPKKCVYQYRRL